VTELFRLPLLVSGTVYRSTSHPRSHCQSSAVASRHISSGAVLPVTMLLCLRSDVVIFGHVNRFLLTYLQLTDAQRTSLTRSGSWRLSRCDIGLS